MSKIQTTQYTHRLLARFVIEAKTPLAIGTGQKSVLSDSVVALDVNGLPYIPGTSLAGVLRSMMDPKHESELFGYQKDRHEVKNGEPKGLGSEIIISEARILDASKRVMDGIQRRQTLKNDPLLKQYLRPMPVRQHVRINEKGTAMDGAKFDQQVVYAGTRFCFEIEIIAKNKDQNNLNDIIQNLKHQSFRIGGGVHNGFGRIEVVSAQQAVLNLALQEDREAYLAKSSSLADDSFWKGRNESELQAKESDGYVHYRLTLQPDDFFLFGSGYGDTEGNADMTSVKAGKINWSSGTGVFECGKTLIPATSIKGALRHRVAYHYNKLKGLTIGGTKGSPLPAEENPAVRAIFGWQDGKTLVPGHILLEDVIESAVVPKLINHVSIDRFTGGAIDGALFTEQADYGKGKTYTLDIYVEREALTSGEKIKESFEAALDDICKGMLPLGGGVNRGNGIFHGSITND